MSEASHGPAGNGRSRCSDEVIKTIDLCKQYTIGTFRRSLVEFAHLPFSGTSKVPLLTELASASNAGNGEHPLAFLNEFQDGSAKERVDRDVETSVSYDPSPTVSSRIQKEEGKDVG